MITMYLYEAGLATVVNDVDSLLPSPILQQLRCPLAVHLFGCCPVTKLALYSGSLFIYMPYFVRPIIIVTLFVFGFLQYIWTLFRLYSTVC